LFSFPDQWRFLTNGDAEWWLNYVFMLFQYVLLLIGRFSDTTSYVQTHPRNGHVNDIIFVSVFTVSGFVHACKTSCSGLLKVTNLKCFEDLPVLRCSPLWISRKTDQIIPWFSLDCNIGRFLCTTYALCLVLHVQESVVDSFTIW